MRAHKTLSVLAFVALALHAPSSAHATSNRIFMSTSGNNAGDCANPLTPCLTFAGAMAQVNPGGEIIAEATGGYGPLTITQSVTINGPSGVVIYCGGQVNVNAPGATVILRGLTIDGGGAAGNGIHVVAVGQLHVESSVITGFTGNDTTGNGIYLSSAGRLFVKDTVIREVGWVGIYVHPLTGTARASVDHSRLEGNEIGMSSVYNSTSSIRDSVISGNLFMGLDTEGATSETDVENCLVANNGRGISSNAATVRVSNTTITDNDNEGLWLLGAGAVMLTRLNNTLEGNTPDGSFTAGFPAK